jgi:hypothetical protein
MGRLIRENGRARTQLGPIEAWPQSLRIGQHLLGF